MIIQTRWQPTKTFEPWNPTQKNSINYTGLPGGYSSFYWDQKPNVTHLFGPNLGDVSSFAGKLAWLTAAVAVGTAAGYMFGRMGR